MATRTPVAVRGRTVPGLTQRRTSSGETVYEVKVNIGATAIRRRLEATTAEAAAQEAEAVRAEVRRGTAAAQPRNGGVSFGAMLDAHAERLVHEGRSPRTISSAKERRPHLAALEQRSVKSITRRDLSDLVVRLQREGYAASSVRSIVGLASAALSEAVEREFIATNPARGMRLPSRTAARGAPFPRGRRRARRCGDAEDAAAYRDPGRHGRPRQRGTRPALGRRRGRHRHRRCAATRRRAARAEDGRGAPTDRDDSARAPDPRRAPRAALALGLAGSEQFVFASATGKPMDRRRAHRVVTETARRCGLDRTRESLRVHDLRSALLTAAVVYGTDLATVQRLAGHATARVTLDVYARLAKEKVVAPFALDEEAVALPAGGDVVNDEHETGEQDEEIAFRVRRKDNTRERKAG